MIMASSQSSPQNCCREDMQGSSGFRRFAQPKIKNWEGTLDSLNKNQKNKLRLNLFKKRGQSIHKASTASEQTVGVDFKCGSIINPFNSSADYILYAKLSQRFHDDRNFIPPAYVRFHERGIKLYHSAGQ